MRSIEELKAMVVAAEARDGDMVTVAMRKIADAQMTLMWEMLERIEALDAMLNAPK